MQITCESCEGRYQSKPAPCPDGMEGCCVAHSDDKSFLCDHCGHDMGPTITKHILEGNVTELPGIAIINTAAIKKLELG